MKNNRKLLGFLLSVWITASCSGQKDMIVIRGHLENLPDGKMALYTRSRQTGVIIPIDTAETRNGSFSFTIDRAAYPEPIRVFLNHKEAGTDTLRAFSFKTNLNYRGNPLGLDHFFLEDGINLIGKISEQTYPGFEGYPHVKFVSADRPIITGRQTQVAYNDTIGFDRLTNVNQVKKLVGQHPYSYHYLYAIERRVTELSNAQFMVVFRCFDADVQASPTGRKLLTYVNQRQDKRLTFATTLVDEQGQAQPILDENAHYNLVVLWASWCGPCRKEIPSLKQLYSRLGNSRKLHMVSVSVDEDRSAWLKAMRKEQMPWRQLRMTPYVQTYAKEIFQFDGSIPTLLLVDRQGKIVKKIVGYEEDSLTAIEALVAGR